MIASGCGAVSIEPLPPIAPQVLAVNDEVVEDVASPPVAASVDTIEDVDNEDIDIEVIDIEEMALNQTTVMSLPTLTSPDGSQSERHSVSRDIDDEQFDLDVPGGVEGPNPIWAIPGQMLFILFYYNVMYLLCSRYYYYYWL